MWNGLYSLGLTPYIFILILPDFFHTQKTFEYNQFIIIIILIRTYSLYKKFSFFNITN